MFKLTTMTTLFLGLGAVCEEGSQTYRPNNYKHDFYTEMGTSVLTQPLLTRCSA